MQLDGGADYGRPCNEWAEDAGFQELYSTKHSMINEAAVLALTYGPEASSMRSVFRTRNDREASVTRRVHLELRD